MVNFERQPINVGSKHKVVSVGTKGQPTRKGLISSGRDPSTLSEWVEVMCTLS